MDEEEWEVIPHKILADLRDEVHVLKEKISQPNTRKDMVDAMVELKKSIDDMHGIFKTALETVGKDNTEEILKRLSAIEKQNDQIAQALVSVADLVENKREMPSMAMPSMPAPPMPMRAPPPRPRQAPPAFAPSSLPPPPPAPKRGILGKLMT